MLHNTLMAYLGLFASEYPNVDGHGCNRCGH